MHWPPRFVTLLLTLLLLAPPGGRSVSAQDAPLNVVATTTQIADLARVIGGDTVSVTGIMQPGVDPHLYRASESDLNAMLKADVIFYNGLNLEGKMSEIFVHLASEKPVVPLGAQIPADQLLNVPDFPEEYDPHFWFDPTLWMMAAQVVADTLAEADSNHAEAYQANAVGYIAELAALNAANEAALGDIPENQRVLVTAHDAFGYFGNRYGFDVIGIQGLSTETEAGIADMQRVADIIIESNVPAIFVESTISPATIEAVQAAVADKGGAVVIGGSLYSDAMGDAGTPEGTYLGMYQHNINTIVSLYLAEPVATPES